MMPLLRSRSTPERTARRGEVIDEPHIDDRQPDLGVDHGPARGPYTRYHTRNATIFSSIPTIVSDAQGPSASTP